MKSTSLKNIARRVLFTSAKQCNTQTNITNKLHFISRLNATSKKEQATSIASKPFSGVPIAPVTPCEEVLDQNGFGEEPSRRDILDLIWRNKQRKELSIDKIASELGYTNVYTAQLLLMNTPLNPSKASQFQQILELPDSCMNELMKSPHRRFDESINQEPNTYRLLEAVQHNGEALKLLTNEKFGDGIMSAIDFYVSVDKVIGPNGEDRVEIKFNGKFLPFIEQNVSELQKCKPPPKSKSKK